VLDVVVVSTVAAAAAAEFVLFCFIVYPPDAPEPPVVCEVHSTSCTVTYQPPLRDGGAPASYILERRTPGPDAEWIRVNDIPVTDLQCTVDNLIPATEYEFHVAAVNKKWMSDFSLMSPKIVTVEKPDKPGLLEVMDVTGTSARLQWTAPSSDGGADITEYIVMYWTSKTTDYIPVPVDVNMESLFSYTIRNTLQADTQYRFAVSAANSLCQGPWSDRTDGFRTYPGMLNT